MTLKVAILVVKRLVWAAKSIAAMVRAARVCSDLLPNGPAMVCGTV